MPTPTENPGRPEQARAEPEVIAMARANQDELEAAPAEKRRSGATGARVYGFLLVSLGAILFVILGFSYEHSSFVAMADFKPLYYGARCLLTGRDLYSQEQLRRLYFAEGDEPQSQKLKLIDNVGWAVNSPTTYMLVTPLAALSWRVANVVWTMLTCATFLLAALLVWELGSRSAPVASGLLICLFLIGQELLIEVGNTAGMVVALCLIAVWCFLRKKFELAGVLCLAVSLAVKPHDSGLVWLYFLAAGGALRKRALQTLVCAVAISLPAILWVHHLGPDWMLEMHQNLAGLSARGAFNDPGPAALDPRFHGSIVVSLQSAISLFRDDPNLYNPLSYLIGGLLLIIWLTIGARSRFAQSLAPLALATVAALTMLPVYHRQHDTGLLLLTVPACAQLWSEGRWMGRWALFITAAAAILLNNLTLQFLAIVSTPIYAAKSGLSGLILNLLLTRPAPIVLMAIGIFYLWEYFAKTRKNSALSPQGPNSFSPFRAINLPAQSIPSAMIAGDEK
jgi:hypothetical protein